MVITKGTIIHRKRVITAGAMSARGINRFMKMSLSESGRSTQAQTAAENAT